MREKRIYISPPHLTGEEAGMVQEAIASNWIAPGVGPHLEAFEREFCAVIGAAHAVALSSGTAALHLALQLLGTGPGDEVLCPTLTFAASAFPVNYLGARPVFIDSDRVSWNMDPGLLAEALKKKAEINKLPKAVIVVHLYGQCADLDPILETCRNYEVPIIEDAAEALGATYKGKPAGTIAGMGIYSFNGNKIITTSGGGMLVTKDAGRAEMVRRLADQARDPAAHYQHSSIGYNYRLSNILAALGLGQLRVLKERVAARRANFDFYDGALKDLPGVTFMPEAPFGSATRWLTCLTIDAEQAGVSTGQIRLALEDRNIESRPVWKPMHLQPVFKDCEVFGGAVSEDLFLRGLCLPSGSALSEGELAEVAEAVRSLF